MGTLPSSRHCPPSRTDPEVRDGHLRRHHDRTHRGQLTCPSRPQLHTIRSHHPHAGLKDETKGSPKATATADAQRRRQPPLPPSWAPAPACEVRALLQPCARADTLRVPSPPQLCLDFSSSLSRPPCSSPPKPPGKRAALSLPPIPQPCPSRAFRLGAGLVPKGHLCPSACPSRGWS